VSQKKVFESFMLYQICLALLPLKVTKFYAYGIDHSQRL